MLVTIGPLTLSLPRVPNNQNSRQIPNFICKTLKYKKCHVKVLLKRFHLNGNTIGFHPQTQMSESP